MGQLVAREEGRDRFLGDKLVFDLLVGGEAIALLPVNPPPKRVVDAHVRMVSAERTLLQLEHPSVFLPRPRMRDDVRDGLHVLGAEVDDELGDTVEEVLLGAEFFSARGHLDFLVQHVATDATHLGILDLEDGIQNG